MKIVPIRTRRLLLRRPRLSDAAAAVPLLNDLSVARFTHVPHPYSRHLWVAWMGKHRRGPERRPEGLSFPRVIERDGALVGMVGLRWDEKNRTANIGYWVGRPYRRQGIATEAVEAITRHAFVELGAAKVWATVFTGNVGSPRVLEKVGMRLEGVLRSHMVHRGRRVDVAHYGVLRSEWRGRRP